MPLDVTTPVYEADDWVSYAAPYWKKAIDACDFPIRRGLEIGVLEGRASLWFVENYFQDFGFLLGIDPFAYPPGHHDGYRARFFRNLGEHIAAGRMKIAERPSQEQLIYLANGIYPPRDNKGELFDFAYIDGSHYSWDVIQDLILTFRILRVGGVIICDDYLWHPKPEQATKYFAWECPAKAIEAFMLCFGPKLQQEPSASRQRIFRKLSD